MAWKAKRRPTQAEVKHAIELLSSWKMGIIEENGHIQYRGDWHPNYGKPGKHHGVEVWTDIPEDQYGYKPSGEPMANNWGTTTDAERAKVLAEGEARGYPAEELNASIQIESGWQPHAFAKSTNAGGLIGFMPFVLKKLGWEGTPEEFRAQSSGEQAEWVGAFFDLVGANRWRVPGDTYLALAASGHVGAPDSKVIYAKGTKAWELNPGWRPKDGGDITAGSIRALLLRKMGSMPPLVLSPKPVPPKAPGWFSSVWASVLRWLRGAWLR